MCNIKTQTHLRDLEYRVKMLEDSQIATETGIQEVARKVTECHALLMRGAHPAPTHATRTQQGLRTAAAIKLALETLDKVIGTFKGTAP